MQKYQDASQLRTTGYGGRDPRVVDYKLVMPENPKEKKDGTWEEDQKDHEYYYDDAHGYEEFDPDDEDDEEGEKGRKGEGETS